jgi:thioredoxin reductase (NADPH)
VLLTAYADTDAAIQSINEVGLDHYLMKPWQPPEDVLYPVIDELLDDWHRQAARAVRRDPGPGGALGRCAHDVKDFLARNQIPYRFLDVEHDREGQSLLATLDDASRLPVVLLPDGQALAAPDVAALAAAVGLSRRGERARSTT